MKKKVLHRETEIKFCKWLKDTASGTYIQSYFQKKVRELQGDIRKMGE